MLWIKFVRKIIFINIIIYSLTTNQNKFIDIKKNEGKTNLEEFYIYFKYKMFFYLIIIIIDYKRLKISFNNEKTSMFSDVNLLYKFLNLIGIMKWIYIYK